MPALRQRVLYAVLFLSLAVNGAAPPRELDAFFGKHCGPRAMPLYSTRVVRSIYLFRMSLLVGRLGNRMKTGPDIAIKPLWPPHAEFRRKMFIRLASCSLFFQCGDHVSRLDLA